MQNSERKTKQHPAQQGRSQGKRQAPASKPSRYPLYVADSLALCMIFYITDFNVPLRIFFAACTRLIGYDDSWTRDANGFLVGAFLIGGAAAWAMIRFDFLPRYIKGKGQ